MRTTLLTLLLVLPLLASDPLSVDDKLSIRTAQVGYLQSRMALVQAQQEAERMEKDFNALIESLRKKYNCQQCSLTGNLEWVEQSPRPDSPKPPDVGKGNPAGATQKEKTQ